MTTPPTPSSLVRQAFSAEAFRAQGEALVHFLAEHLERTQQGEGPAVPWQTPAEALAYWQADFAAPPANDPLPLWKEITERVTQIHHPRYMGHQVATPAPQAALMGLLSNFLNNGMAVYEMGMVSNPIERVLTDFVAQKVGFGEESSGFLTSGGTLANLTALLAARAVVCKEDIWEEGTYATPLAVMVSEEAHYCVDRAVRVMGLGADGIIKIPTNAAYQMQTEALETALAEARQKGVQVIAVVASACSTSTGSYDNLVAIADFCEQHGLWMHVDGAHGGAVVLSEKYKSLVAGIERADSVLIDFHKMLLTPALSTAVLFRKGGDAYRTFHQRAQYLWDDPEAEEWFNSGKRTFECTKLMMALKTYTLLRSYGERLFAEHLDYLHDLAHYFADYLREQHDFELAVVPQSNIVCFRYRPEGRLSAEFLNQLNTRLRRRMLEKGDFYLVQTTLRGEVYLRVSLMNPLTTWQTLEELIEALRLQGLLLTVERFATSTD